MKVLILDSSNTDLSVGVSIDNKIITYVLFIY